MKSIKDIQNIIKTKNVDAWVIVDYENKNNVLVNLLGKKMLTRKIFLVIPSIDKPYLICHSIDTAFLKDKNIEENFNLYVYKTWQEMLDLEKRLFSNYKSIYMDISENGLLPRVSLADYGSVSFIKNLGIQIHSSADLLQMLTTVYSSHSFDLQLRADELTLKIKDEAFKKIKELINKNGETDEYTIQQFICERFKQEGLTYDEAPIVAIGKNASNPHYGPTKNNYSKIKMGDLVLIDMWAKLNDIDAVYADITWMGYVGEDVPNIYNERFSILKKDIDLCLEFLKRELPLRDVKGYEVDDVSRKYINEKGYGQYYVHRVGHNIAVDVSPHGPGVNMDNYETHDDRSIINGICFSLEPGIYALDFGMRSETNVYIKDKQPLVVAGRQEKIIPIMSIK